MAVITISRLAGALGDTLGEAVAQRLAYRFIRREDLVRLAETLGGSDLAWDRAPELRERSPSFWERFNEERRRYSSVLRRVVVHLAEQDNVVLMGLGAGYVLRGLNNVLRVQVTAPMDVRLERIMQHGYEEVPGPLTREQARDLVRRVDREAAGYMRYLFNIDWLDPAIRDLVINTGRFTVPQATDIIAAVVEGGLLEPTPAHRQRLASLALVGRIETAILGDASTWVKDLKVYADEGRVRIEGEVIAEEDREAVEELVQSVEGVSRVDNDLRVQPPPLTGM